MIFFQPLKSNYWQVVIFSEDFPTDRGNEGKRAMLINEAASKLLGFKTPQEAVHSHISSYWGADYEIIGVVNSFHQLSLKENLQPLYFMLQPRALAYYAVNFKGENIQHVVGQLRKSWNNIFPDTHSIISSWISFMINNISTIRNSATL